MHVNRICFRAFKSALLGLALFAPAATGRCHAAQEPVASIMSVISRTHGIYEVRLSDPCEELSVWAVVGGRRLEVAAPQGAENQGETRDKRVILDLGDGGVGAGQTPEACRLITRCEAHGEQAHQLDFGAFASSSFATPDWAKGIVWYQVFPERFRDGNPGNNPMGWDLTPLDWDAPFGVASVEEIERAWNRRLSEPDRFAYRTGRAGGAVPNVVYARRYGGDLIGVYNQLEALKRQGFTGIYLCPVFRSRSLHKYDADDHRHIDPTLGAPGVYVDPGPGHTALLANEDPSDETTWSWTVADRWFVDVFLPKAKSLGLRVVLDGVWNHVGTDHFAFRDVREHGRESLFAGWFHAEFGQRGELLAWQGWDRVNGNLPEFVQENGDLAPGPKAHIMAVTRRWMDPNGDGDPSDGIDGWRLDVAGEIGDVFWADWRSLVKGLNPEALIIAEIWSDAGDMLSEKAFDGQMNYPVAYALADWLSIGNTRANASVAAARLARVFNHGPQVDLVQFNLMTSHDTERLASMMHNAFQRGYDNDSRRWGAVGRYDPQTVTADDMERALCAIAAMIASPGSVMIYNGEEHALPGGDDPDNRRPIPWRMLEQDSAGLRSVFNRVVSAVLRLRQDPAYGRVLRFGGARFMASGDALLIERTLGSRKAQVRVDPFGGSVSSKPWPTPEKGWVVLNESSRKYALRDGRNVVDVRLLICE